MSSELEEISELHDLNTELLEVLLVLGQRFIEYAGKYRIEIEGRENLATLVNKAICLLERIGTPCRGNPIVSLSDKRPPDKLPVHRCGSLENKATLCEKLNSRRTAEMVFTKNLVNHFE